MHISHEYIIKLANYFCPAVQYSLIYAAD